MNVVALHVRAELCPMGHTEDLEMRLKEGMKLIRDLMYLGCKGSVAEIIEGGKICGA